MYVPINEIAFQDIVFTGYVENFSIFQQVGKVFPFFFIYVCMYDMSVLIFAYAHTFVL